MSTNDDHLSPSPSQCLKSPEDDRSIRFRMCQLASKVLGYIDNFTLEETLQSAPPIQTGSRLELTDNTALFRTDMTDTLKEIANTLDNLSNSSTVEDVLNNLRLGFTRLVGIIVSGEKAITPQELLSSGLISKFLRCLSPSFCLHWSSLVW